MHRLLTTLISVPALAANVTSRRGHSLEQQELAEKNELFFPPAGGSEKLVVAYTRKHKPFVSTGTGEVKMGAKSGAKPITDQSVNVETYRVGPDHLKVQMEVELDRAGLQKDEYPTICQKTLESVRGWMGSRFCETFVDDLQFTGMSEVKVDPKDKSKNVQIKGSVSMIVETWPIRKKGVMGTRSYPVLDFPDKVSLLSDVKEVCEVGVGGDMGVGFVGV